MKIVRKFEEVCIHNLREVMLKKYRKTYLLMSVAWIAFWMNTLRGKMKNYNRYYESSYNNPMRQVLFVLP